MGLFEKILFPVTFSEPCTAMASYVKRAAEMFGSKVTLVHVFDLESYAGFELYARPAPDVLSEHQAVARDKLNSYLRHEFPLDRHPRVLMSGATAEQIAALAHSGGFDLIIMPTNAGFLRKNLLGSTTAKVLNEVNCPVMTTRHAESSGPRNLAHREWVCAVGLTADSERVLRIANKAAAEAGAKLTLVHAMSTGEAGNASKIDGEGHEGSSPTSIAQHKLDELQKTVGSNASTHVVAGPIREVLLDAVRRFDADALVIGRSAHPSALGRMSDLTYTLVRDSPCPVLSV